MNSLSFSALNVNSLARADPKLKINSPYLSFLKKTKDICFLSDVRLSEQRFQFMSDHLSLSQSIGKSKTRLFSTLSETLKTGGTAIFIPQSLDDVLKVAYISRDEAVVPRFISLICQITGGPRIVLSSFYGSPGNVGEKAKALRRFYNSLYSLVSKFSCSTMIIGADFNISLDTIDGGGSDKKVLKKIVDDFGLIDSYRACPQKLDKKDVIRLSGQEQTAQWNDKGYTFYPKISGFKPSRIDGILFSSCLEKNTIEKSFCLSLSLSPMDHKGVHLSISWMHAGIPMDNLKPSFFFHNHLLQEKPFLRKIKMEIANAILEAYHEMGGILSRKETNGIRLDQLESLLFDRLKNSSCLFSAIDLLYNIFNKIEKAQNCFLKGRTSKEKGQEESLIDKIVNLESISSPSRSQQKSLIAANRELSDLQKRKIQRQSRDMGLNFEALGEAGSKHFLRSKVASRSKAFVRIFQKRDGEICHDSLQIEEEFFNHYKNILEAPDPFCPQAFYDFVNPILDKFGRISEEDRRSFNYPISLQELKLAIGKIKANVCAGPDGVTGKLIIFVHSICPRLVHYAINMEILKGGCVDKEIMLRKLIFIPKPNYDKITIKRFRPISLVNSLFKVADNCVVSRIVSGLENAKTLPPYMSAYRSGHSTTDAIISLQCFINNANMTGRKLVILNWDVSAAFDKCSRLMVQEILRILGFSDLLIESVKNLPMGALARLCINLAETRFPNIAASNGCAQGLGSSAQFFSLATLCILLRLNMSDVATYKLDLCIQKKVSLVEKYTESIWADEGHTGTISSTFRKSAKAQWKQLSSNERKDFKAKMCQKRFHKQTSIRLSQIDSTISYSDDGHIFLEYKEIQDILKVMEIFESFGRFSGLMINPDKTRIVTLNFSLNGEELKCLTDRGFDPEMINDGNKTFRFLGCDILPNQLKSGVTKRLDQLCDEMEVTAEAFDKDTTLKGRRVICQTLLLSRLQSALTGFDLSESDLCRVQKIIDGFVHKKKVAAGKRKYLAFSNGGIQIPRYFERYLVARVCLLKGLFTKLSNGQTPPLWGQILLEGLKYIGFNSPTILFNSMGQADLKFISKCFNELGLNGLASLFQSAIIINEIFESKRCKLGRKGGKKQKSNKNRSLDLPTGITCFSHRLDFFGQKTGGRALCYKNKHGVFRDAPDPPSGFRSLSLIGTIHDNNLQRRNDQSMFAIWKELQVNNNMVPAFEFSARNVYLSKWILNNAASPITLLNEENVISPSDRILPIIRQSSRSESIFRALAAQAQTMCTKLAVEVGPGSPVHQHNIFLSWIVACTSHNNGKSLYYQLLNARYGEETSTAIVKLRKAGITGKIDNIRIARGLLRGVKTFNSAKMERATIELSLAAMRNYKDIARIHGIPQKPCYCCGSYEGKDDLGSGGFSPLRGMLRHAFLNCSPAAFLIQFLESMAIRVFGFKIQITLELILLNELPPEKLKNTSEESRKTWFAILNSYKTAIYSLYYLRPAVLSGDFILNRFRYNLEVARTVAQSRGSTLMNNISLPVLSFGIFKDFRRIHRIVMEDTSCLRNEDRIARRRAYVQSIPNSNQANTNLPRRRNTNATKIPSKQKRQILITQAFQKIEKTFTKGGNPELAVWTE